MSYIHSIGTSVPEHAYQQMDLCQFMLKKIPLDKSSQEKLTHFYRSSGIQTRHSVLPDFGEGDQNQLFSSPQNASLSKRMNVFHEAVMPLSLEAVQNCIKKQQDYQLKDITHLIAVSCTGLSAPGLDLMLLRELQLPSTTHRTCVHYMGCYAALHALKQANAICQSNKQAVVLLVCAELCTLHFQQSATMDSLTSSLLFADGSAAVILSSKPSPVKIQNFYSDVALDGWDDMAWHLSEEGFIMHLKPEVPYRLKEGMKALVTQALKHQKLSLKDIDFWALHPGGRKIVDLVEQELHLTSQAIKGSREVLKHFGNMSSPTVLFVLEYILEKQINAPNQTIFSASFGPGLTMETMTITHA